MKKYTLLFIIICLSFVLIFIYSKKPEKNLEFESITNFPSIRSYDLKSKYVFRNKRSFTNFLEKNSNNSSITPRSYDLYDSLKSEIDFKKQMLIVIFSEPKPSGGYSIVIDEIIERPFSIEVIYYETIPGPSSAVYAAVTYPRHAITIKKTPKRIFFTKKY